MKPRDDKWDWKDDLAYFWPRWRKNDSPDELNEFIERILAEPSVAIFCSRDVPCSRHAVPDPVAEGECCNSCELYSSGLKCYICMQPACRCHTRKEGDGHERNIHSKDCCVYPNGLGVCGCPCHTSKEEKCDGTCRQPMQKRTHFHADFAALPPIEPIEDGTDIVSFARGWIENMPFDDKNIELYVKGNIMTFARALNRLQSK